MNSMGAGQLKYLGVEFRGVGHYLPERIVYNDCLLYTSPSPRD